MRYDFSMCYKVCSIQGIEVVIMAGRNHIYIYMCVCVCFLLFFIEHAPLPLVILHAMLIY
jgi:hypothetical protein